MRVLVSAIAASAAFVGVQGQSARCIMPQFGEHPAVDLNHLTKSGEDYSVESSSSSLYTYHFNVCSETSFRDDTCSEGATVCELKDGKALDVYGFVDTIHLAWEESGSALEMSMTGAAECPFNKQIPYTSKIHFVCNHEDEKVTLRSEMYYQCAVEFEVHTAIACGNTGHTYKCDPEQHMCIVDEGGEYPTLDDCTQHCHPAPDPPPPPPPAGSGYNCMSNFTCEYVEGGPWSEKDKCQERCAPFVPHYSCFQDRCVRDTRGSYTNENDCIVACQPIPTKWACGDDYTCTEDADGSYNSDTDCEAACHDPSAKLYHCDPSLGHCIEAEEGIPSEYTCNQACSTAFEQAVVRGRVVQL